MDKAILKKILQLDSLINFLSWQERTQIHHYNGEEISPKILNAFDWIVRENWEAPNMKYGQDRLIYFFHPVYDCWFVDEDYLKLYPEYKNDLLQLKQ